MVRFFSKDVAYANAGERASSGNPIVDIMRTRTHEATVVFKDGSSVHAKGYSEDNAIGNAVEKAAEGGASSSKWWKW